MLREQEQKSRDFWESKAGDALPGLLSFDDRLARYRHAAELKVLFTRLPEFAPASVLEVGCGGGRWTTELAKRAGRVMACDIAPNLVAVARQRAADEQLSNISFQCGSFETLEYERAAAFDLVYLGSCLHYMSEEAIEEALSRLAGSVTRDCVLLSRDTVSRIGRTFHRSERYPGNDPAIYRPEQFYRELMLRHGFALGDAWTTYARPLSWHVLRWLPDKLLEPLMSAELALASAEVRLIDRLPSRADKAHRFFLYRRQSADPSAER